MSQTPGKSPPYAAVQSALITVQVIFAVNYVLSKVVVEAFPPLVWASIRIIIAAAVLHVIAIAAKRPFPKGGFKGFFGPLIAFSLLGTIINQGCFLVGLKYTTSTNSAILNTLIPVFTLLVVTIRGQEALTGKKAMGFVSALAGVLVLRKIEDFNLSDQTAIGDLLMIINCLSYAIFLSYAKKFLETHDRLWTTAWMFTYGWVGLTVISIPDWAGIVWPEMDAWLWFCTTFAIIGGTLLTYFLNNWALAYARSSSVALWIYIQPVITAGIAWAYFGEEITARTVLSSGLIFVGMLLGLAKDRPQPEPA